MDAALYQYNWDRLRVLASLDIVGSHLAGQHLFWGVGTPLFLILTVAFGVHRITPRLAPLMLGVYVLHLIVFQLAVEPRRSR